MVAKSLLLVYPFRGGGEGGGGGGGVRGRRGSESEPKRMRKSRRGDEIGETLPEFVETGSNVVDEVLFVADDGGLNLASQHAQVRLDERKMSEEERL